jgi:hypothetical protein
MPLVWTHAEYLKLRRSLHDGRLFDLPPQAVQRYLVDKMVMMNNFTSSSIPQRREESGK